MDKAPIATSSGVFSLEGDDLVEAAARLEGVISSVVSIDQDDAVSSSDRLPAAFIERNEVFRGVVLRDHRPEVAEAYARVDACLTELEASVADFPDGDDVLYDAVWKSTSELGSSRRTHGDNVASTARGA